MLVEKQYKKLKYLLALPQNFDESASYPVIFYLHGAGGRGDDLDIIKNDEIFSKNPCLDEFVVVAPQCYADTWFDLFEQLTEFCDFVNDSAFCDKRRFYATGVSMGGYACWQLLMSRPDAFAAALVCCGGGMYWNAGKLKNLPVMAFHGAKDLVVLPEESEKMVNAIGDSARLVVYPEADHDCWTPTYSDEANFRWLLSHSKDI